MRSESVDVTPGCIFRWVPDLISNGFCWDPRSNLHWILMAMIVISFLWAATITPSEYIVELKSRQVISLRQGTDPQWILTADYVSMVSSMSFLAEIPILPRRRAWVTCKVLSLRHRVRSSMDSYGRLRQRWFAWSLWFFSLRRTQYYPVGNIVELESRAAVWQIESRANNVVP